MTLPDYITIADVEAAINMTAYEWVGRCYEVSCMVLDAGLVEGRPAYGFYTGDVREDSMFVATKIGCRHGWIRLQDGRVFDITRWCFTTPDAPHVYVGPEDVYDFGGNEVRRAMMKPCPEYDLTQGDGKPRSLDSMPDDVARFVILKLLTPHGAGSVPAHALSPMQVAWLSNLPLDMYEDHAHAIYTWIEAQGMVAFIPIDNRTHVLGDV